MKPTLHIFPFSNFCEKAIWTLEYAGIDTNERVHLPGPHARATKGLSGQTAVPILEIGSEILAGSDSIARYAHEKAPSKEIIPRGHKEDILAWQKRLDDIGATLRGALFHEILDRPGLAKDILTSGSKQGFFGGYSLFFRAFCPLLRKMLRDELPSAEDARAQCRSVMDAVAEEAEASGYLVGRQFTLADLTAASIFYPVVLPEKALGAAYAKSRPEMRQWLSFWEDHPIIPYVERMYATHR